MTRMWVGTVYIISGLSLSLLIFSGCQQHFGDQSEQVSSQARPCTNTVKSFTHRQMPGMDKKTHLYSKPCSKFCAPEGGKPSLSPGGSNLSRSGTRFWNSFSNSALVHELSMQTLKFFGMQCLWDVSSLRQCFSDFSPRWLVQLPHTCVPVPSTSFKCGWWHMGNFGVIQLYYKHQHSMQGGRKDPWLHKALKWILLKRKPLMTYGYRPPWWSWFIPEFKKTSHAELIETRWHCGLTAGGCWHLAYKQGQHWKELILPKLGVLKHILLSNPQWGRWKAT